jgi:hypothetical protein
MSSSSSVQTSGFSLMTSAILLKAQSELRSQLVANSYARFLNILKWEQHEGTAFRFVGVACCRRCRERRLIGRQSQPWSTLFSALLTNELLGYCPDGHLSRPHPFPWDLRGSAQRCCSP